MDVNEIRNKETYYKAFSRHITRLIFQISGDDDGLTQVVAVEVGEGTGI